MALVPGKLFPGDDGTWSLAPKLGDDWATSEDFGRHRFEPDENGSAMALQAARIEGDLASQIWKYVAHGVRPDDFLCAVIDNDLTAAMLRMDRLILPRDLKALVVWLENYTTPACHGSLEKRLAWERGDAPPDDEEDL